MSSRAHRSASQYQVKMHSTATAIGLETERSLSRKIPDPPSCCDEDDRAGLVQDAEVHRSCVQINSAVMRMLLRIEFHWPPPLSPFGDDSFIRMVDPSIKPV